MEEKKQIENIEEPKEEIKEEVKVKSNKKFRIFNIILVLITIFIIVVFVLFMKTSITNFNLVKDKKEPTGYIEKVECEKDFKEYTYYRYTLFKIEIAKSKKDTSYTIIPSFKKDVCQELGKS